MTILYIQKRQSIEAQVRALYPDCKIPADLPFHLCHCGSGLIEQIDFNPTSTATSGADPDFWVNGCHACRPEIFK